MASFPNLTCGQPVKYPLQREVHYPCRVLQFGNDTEQRFLIGAQLARFNLQFRRISKADMNTLKGFFETMKGAFDDTWDITLNAELFSYCCFDTDEFKATENRHGQYDVALPVRQARKN